MNNWKRLMKIILEQKREHAYALFFLILQSICSLLLPFLLVEIVDSGIGKNDYSLLLRMGILYLILAIMHNIFKAMSDYMYATIGGEVVLSLRKKLLNHFSKMSGSYYSDIKSGEIFSIITDDVGTIQELCTNAIFRTVTDIIMAIPLIIFLFYLDYRLFLVSVILQPLYVIIQNKVAHSIGRHSEEIRDSFGDYSIALQEYLYNPINAVKTKSDTYILSKIVNYVKLNVNALICITFDFSKGQIAGSLMQSMSSILTILVGGLLIISGESTIGSLLVFLQYFPKALAPVIGIGQLNMKFKKVVVSLERIFKILDARGDVNYQSGSRIIGIREGNIEFNNVDFSYNDNSTVLPHFFV